jgi:antitoxin ParD1/3/4
LTRWENPRSPVATFERGLGPETASDETANLTDYVRDLVRQDQERVRALAALQAEVDKGIASGITDKSLPGIPAEAKRRSRAVLNAQDAAQNIQPGCLGHP